MVLGVRGQCQCPKGMSQLDIVGDESGWICLHSNGEWSNWLKDAMDGATVGIVKWCLAMCCA